MTVYISRNGGGKINGVYANLQPGLAEEAIDNSDPSVIAYFTGPTGQDLINLIRSNAKAFFQNQQSDNAEILRAVVLVMVDEINALREWITSFKAAVAASTTLANLQTRVAALANLPDRTGAQAKQAILNTIDSGNAD